MKTVKSIENHLDDIQFGWWDPEKEEFYPIELAEDEEGQKLLKREDVIERFLDSMILFTNDLKENIGRDLKDIWERLDRIENL